MQIKSTNTVDGPYEAQVALFGLTYAVDANRSFPVTGDDGQVYNPVPQPLRSSDDYTFGFTLNLVYDVPEGFAAGTLAIQPTGDFFAPTTDGSLPGPKPVPFTWSKRLDTQQVPLKPDG